MSNGKVCITLPSKAPISTDFPLHTCGDLSVSQDFNMLKYNS